MKIDDKIISYEVTGNMRKLSAEASERLEAQKSSSEKPLQEQQPLQGDAIVHLSQTSKEAKAVRELLGSLPDERSEKVSLLRDKIESGTYKVDYEGVADKLVEAFLEDLL